MAGWYKVKKLRTCLLMVCISALSLLCFPATTCAKYELYNEDYTEWYCEEGYMGFTTAVSDSSAYGFIVINGIKARALFSLSTPYGYEVEVDYDESFGVTKEPIDYVDDSFAVGCYSARFDGDLQNGVFSVYSFTLCDIEFPAFVMYSRKVDPSDINARNYADCDWGDKDSFICISERTWCGVDVHMGTINVNSEDIPIFFKWCDYNRFEIYNGDDGAEERPVLASGTYTNDVLNLSLTFEKDTTFGYAGKTINLTGECR